MRVYHSCVRDACAYLMRTCVCTVCVYSLSRPDVCLFGKSYAAKSCSNVERGQGKRLQYLLNVEEITYTTKGKWH